MEQAQVQAQVLEQVQEQELELSPKLGRLHRRQATSSHLPRYGASSFV